MLIDRRSFIALTTASWAAAPEQPLLILSAADARRIRPRKLFTAALDTGPWSVTYHRPKGIGTQAGPNDYYSEGPYWWPDPKNPGAPYIRKDGERNPDRFMGNRSDIGDMSEAVLALGMNACFLGDGRSAERAAQVLSVWFLDPKTRMNPNLEFGQAVRGHNDGRGSGMIDTVSFIQAVQGIMLLEHAGKLDRSAATGLRRWFADYLKWMTTSKKGLTEKKAGNNHATWWTAQVAAYAAFVGDAAARQMAWDHYRNYLVPTEVRPDGSCPREEARTRSLSYSAMNLDAFSVICRLAQLDGVDLWPNVEKCFTYLMPYVANPKTWHKPQITSFDQDKSIFLGLAGLGLRSEPLLAAYRKLPHAGTPWVQLIDLLVGNEKVAVLTADELCRRGIESAPLKMQFRGTTAADCRAWQTEFAGKLRAMLVSHRPPDNWRTITERVVELKDHTRHELVLAADGVPTLPVHLLVPPGKARRAGILAIHGHGPFGYDAIAGKLGAPGIEENIAKLRYDYGLQLVRRGYVVAVPCLVPFGRRLGDADAYGGENPCAVAFVRMQLMGKLLIAENLRDCLWAFESLARHPAVDPQRLACAGLSYGGRMTMLVSALEPRIRVAVIGGALNLLREKAAAELFSCGAQVIPGLLEYGDTPEISSLIAPRYCLWTAGSHDKHAKGPGAEIALARMGRAFKALGAADRLQVDHFEGGHQWSGRLAYPLLEKVLGA